MENFNEVECQTTHPTKQLQANWTVENNLGILPSHLKVGKVKLRYSEEPKAGASQSSGERLTFSEPRQHAIQSPWLGPAQGLSYPFVQMFIESICALVENPLEEQRAHYDRESKGGRAAKKEVIDIATQRHFKRLSHRSARATTSPPLLWIKGAPRGLPGFMKAVPRGIVGSGV